MLYVYTDRKIVKNLVENIPNVKIIEKSSTRWLEDFEIQPEDKILFIAYRPLRYMKYEENMIGSLHGYNFVSNKIQTRKFLTEHNYPVPKTWYDIMKAEYPFIARPQRHSLRKSFYIIRDDAAKKDFLENTVHTEIEWYYSELIDIDKEYRVMFMNGEVFLVYSKVVEATLEETIKSRDSGNIIQKEYVDDLSEDIISTCLDSMSKIKIGYGAIDLVVDKKGKEYILEINSMPNLQRGSVGKAFIKAVKKVVE